jgi:hypothetical protein
MTRSATAIRIRLSWIALVCGALTGCASAPIGEPPRSTASASNEETRAEIAPLIASGPTCSVTSHADAYIAAREARLRHDRLLPEASLGNTIFGGDRDPDVPDDTLARREACFEAASRAWRRAGWTDHAPVIRRLQADFRAMSMYCSAVPEILRSAARDASRVDDLPSMLRIIEDAVLISVPEACRATGPASALPLAFRCPFSAATDRDRNHLVAAIPGPMYAYIWAFARSLIDAELNSPGVHPDAPDRHWRSIIDYTYLLHDLVVAMSPYWHGLEGPAREAQLGALEVVYEAYARGDVVPADGTHPSDSLEGYIWLRKIIEGERSPAYMERAREIAVLRGAVPRLHAFRIKRAGLLSAAYAWANEPVPELATRLALVAHANAWSACDVSAAPDEVRLVVRELQGLRDLEADMR